MDQFETAFNPTSPSHFLPHSKNHTYLPPFTWQKAKHTFFLVCQACLVVDRAGERREDCYYPYFSFLLLNRRGEEDSAPASHITFPFPFMPHAFSVGEKTFCLEGKKEKKKERERRLQAGMLYATCLPCCRRRKKVESLLTCCLLYIGIPVPQARRLTDFTYHLEGGRQEEPACPEGRCAGWATCTTFSSLLPYWTSLLMGSTTRYILVPEGLCSTS